MQEIRCNEIFKRTVVFQSPAEVNWLKKGNQRVTSSLCAAPLALNFLIDLLNNLLIYSRKQRVVLSFFCPAGGQDVQTLSFAWHIHLAGLGWVFCFLRLWVCSCKMTKRRKLKEKSSFNSLCYSQFSICTKWSHIYWLRYAFINPPRSPTFPCGNPS